MLTKQYISHKAGSFKRDFKVVGSPTISDDGIVSGFSSANYLVIPNNMDVTSNKTWEVYTKFIYKKASGVNGNLFAGEGNQYIIAWINADTDKITFNIGNGSSWVTGDKPSTTTLLVDKQYYYRLVYDGSTITQYLSENGVDWTNEGSYSGSVNVPSFKMRFGIARATNLPFAGSIDLLHSYIKINGEYWWTGVYLDNEYANKRYILTQQYIKYKPGDFKRDFTVVGSPTITEDGIVSNFSDSNYVKLAKQLNVSDGSTWEIVTKFKFNSTANYQGILGYTGTGLYRSEIADSKFKLMMSSSTENFNIGTLNSRTLEVGVDYWAKVTYDGTEYKLAISTDGINYEVDASVTSSIRSVFASELLFGNGRDGNLNGTIDLKQSYIKVNNEYWWSGFYTENIYANKYHAIRHNNNYY